MSTPTRTYGGWRERRGFGLAGLGGTQTSMALVAVVVLLAMAAVNPSLLVLMGVPLAAAGALVGVRIRGEALAAAIGRRLMWPVAKRRGWTRHNGWCQPGLPGVLRGIRMLECHTVDGAGAALAWDRSRATLTAVFPVDPTGVELVDDHEAQQRARSWRDWLTHLGYLPDLAHVAVVVTSGPISHSPPAVGMDEPLVASVCRELGDADGTYTRSRTVISVTIRIRGRTGVQDAAIGLLDTVAALGQSLGDCAVIVHPVLDMAQMVQWTRSAFDPAVDSGSAAWSDARPMAAQEHWDCYQHEDWVSGAYCWDEPPGERIPVQALAHLLGASSYHKRVCMVYEPVPAPQTARDVERQTQAARFRSQYRRRLGRDETARDRVDLDRAQATADDEATGAGVVDVSLYAVITAHTGEELRRHATDLENRAGHMRLRLRRSYGSQAAGFAAATGLGYVPGRTF